MYGSAMKDDAKKEGLMELIKKMYSMMDKDSAPDQSLEHEALETPDEETSEHDTGMEAMDEGDVKKRSGDLMSKAMGKSEGDGEFDIQEIKDFLTKRRKAPVGKALSVMAVEKSTAPKMKFEKVKKY